MKVHVRLGVAVCLTVFSLTSIILLKQETRWQKILLGTSWDWEAGADGGIDGGTRLVVFGDSWVDNTVEDEEDERGRNWTVELCDEINCTSYLNFAASQSSKSYPEFAPIGALVSNDIYHSSLTPSTQKETQNLVPDLAAQIKEFCAMPPTRSKPAETIFVVSFGIWNIYAYAGLDFGGSRNIINDTINEMFAQLDVLNSWHAKQSSDSKSVNSTDTTTFRVIIPKLFDPTLLPGWLSQRPVPLKPSSVAEEQKNGIYLTNLWNSMLENKIGAWLKQEAEAEADGRSEEQKPGVEKDIFYYDSAHYLLDIILEHQLEDEGLSDASGLGTGDSPFESVYQPCVRDAGVGIDHGLVDLNGRVMCNNPEEYLFWDGFNIGAVANEEIGKQVGKMVSEGETMRKIWEDGRAKGLVA